VFGEKRKMRKIAVIAVIGNSPWRHREKKNIAADYADKR
jgi:hypothetical protein